MAMRRFLDGAPRQNCQEACLSVSSATARSEDARAAGETTTIGARVLTRAVALNCYRTPGTATHAAGRSAVAAGVALAHPARRSSRRAAWRQRSPLQAVARGRRRHEHRCPVRGRTPLRCHNPRCRRSRQTRHRHLEDLESSARSGAAASQSSSLATSCSSTARRLRRRCEEHV